MNPDDIEVTARLLTAAVAGAMIGGERSYHGRAAGFRTHALVCTASSLLMLVPVFEAQWIRGGPDTVRLDPTRMAQGIMTGIGFLGAGVIIKEGKSIRGLTTAASIWITAAIGILAGVGFYYPLVVSVLLTLGMLSILRRLETMMSTQVYYQFDVKFERSAGMNEAALRDLIGQHGFEVSRFTFRLDGEGRILRHGAVIWSRDRSAASRLAETLEGTPTVMEFKIAPTGD